jgi:integrase
MNADVYAMLERYRDLPGDRRVFEGFDLEHGHKKLKKWSKLAGVRPVGLHDLRDTFASSLVKAGKKIKVIQHLLGHVDIGVTEKYMHLDPSDLTGSTDCLLTGVGT